MSGAVLKTEVVVIGSGPGGYTAAFRAADLGRQVALIERRNRLGGVCLNTGCIPSKALLHVAHAITEAASMAARGVHFGKPRIDLDKLRASKEGIVGKLADGLAGLAAKRRVKVIQGSAAFLSPHQLHCRGGEKTWDLEFEHAIIASGSRSRRLPGLPYEDPRLMEASTALELPEIPERLLVVGAGIVGLETACIYAALGSAVTVVESTGELLPECDRDLVKPLEKRIRSEYENVFFNSQLKAVQPQEKGLEAAFAGEAEPAGGVFNRILVAVGRRPNSDGLGAEQAGIPLDEHGFIPVDECQRTGVEHIFAIGDVTGAPLLAHKASHQGRVAAEVIAGMTSSFDHRVIPAVAYTDPELAWAGLTETEAAARGIPVAASTFPWAASGRALGAGCTDGRTKIIYDPQSKRLLGVGIVGYGAGELIAESVLALEMGADVQDLALCIHPHPTLSETTRLAAEVCERTVTDIYLGES